MNVYLKVARALGLGSFPNPVAGPLSITGGLAAPRNLRITASDLTTITYEWDAVPGADGYQLNIYSSATLSIGSLLASIIIVGGGTTTYVWTKI